MKLITELSKEELLNLIYNTYDSRTSHICYCVSCEPKPDLIFDYEATGYICDDCSNRLEKG